MAGHLAADTATTNVLDGVTNDVAGPFILGDSGPFNFLLITNAAALLRIVSTHALTQHVFSTAANLPRISTWHFVDTPRNEREPVRPRFAYEILFDPSTTEWVLPTEMLKQFRGGT